VPVVTVAINIVHIALNNFTLLLLAVTIVTMEDVATFLIQFGLTEKEAQVYLASLKYGSQTASTIAIKTGLPRSTVNFLFGELFQKGLISKENRNNTTYYNAIEPEALLHRIEDKKKNLHKLESDFHNFLPFLKRLGVGGPSFSKVTTYEGLEGLYHLVDDTCQNDESVYFISGHNNMHPKMREYIERVYIPKSKKHTHKNKMIINRGASAEQYVKKAKGVYDEIIFVDPEKNPFHLTTAVHGDHTLFASYDPDDMTGVLIKNSLIADHMRTIFNVVKGAL